MTIEERPLLSSSVRERDIDLVVVQLVQTSTPFREWFSTQLAADTDLSRFLGVSHSVSTPNGETDIELGFETDRGDRHLVLVENKISASFQDQQIERYYERGERYESNGDCEHFTVGLLAPERYVGTAERTAFDSVVTYEDVLSYLDSSDHDGVPYFQTVLESAIEKRKQRQQSSYPLYSEINGRIMDRALPRIRHLVCDETASRPDYEIDTRSPWLQSRAEAHPDAIRYQFKIQLEQDQRTITPGDVEIRMDIEGDADLSGKAEALHSNAARFERDGFEYTGNSTFGVVHDYWEDVDSSDLDDARFLEEVADRYAELVEIGHEVFTVGTQER
ncbi:PD-(D/E)XK nuclease family protein [Haloarchaeobius sp. HRN-SO-5]|uniref:PD-(D/E)XK nuclease family protein n=1 Tax=Haloarchaeobius sp. HRN-SO-5 TaxID=3446118 RepID=UPI003EB98956